MDIAQTYEMDSKKTFESTQNITLNKKNAVFKNSITRAYPQKIPLNFYNYLKQFPSDHPLNKQFIPHPNEIDTSAQAGGLYDPVGDQDFSQKNGIIHRYKSRLLYTPTTACPIQCRYCFRKNELSGNDQIFKSSLEKLISYLKHHPDVKEVILTGGDPLSLTNRSIEQIFKTLADKVDFIRIHTRAPIINPERIDKGLLRIFSDFENVFKRVTFIVHTNHESEIYLQVQQKFGELSRTRVQLLTQSVLLKGINDSVEALVHLFEKISSHHFTPYYLHHPDKVKGAMHFYLSVEKGREIYGQLRDYLSGWMIPHYVIDPPEGRGKNLAYNSEHITHTGVLLDRFNSPYSISIS